MTEVKNPCIGVCKYENDICIGCHRSMYETKNWKNFSTQEKKQIQLKITERKMSIKSEKNNYDHYV